MDEVFRALADASRRRLLDRLNERNGQSLRELSEGLGMSRQAVTKHLAVLESAALVGTVRHGREKLHYLNPVPLHQLADRWIGRYERGRLAALTRLKHTLEEESAMQEPAGPGGREERAGESAGRAAGPRPEFVYTLYIRTTPERLYRALTDPEFIQAYMGGHGPQSDWQVGSSVRWKMSPEGEFEELGQRVLEAEPGRRLSYTWHTLQPMHRELFATDEEFAEALKERSKVTFEITPAEIPELGVKLTLVHDGFESPDSKMLEGVSGGWVMICSSLKTLLEDGERERSGATAR